MMGTKAKSLAALLNYGSQNKFAPSQDSELTDAPI